MKNLGEWTIIAEGGAGNLGRSLPG